jgi:hypothetical protein
MQEVDGLVLEILGTRLPTGLVVAQLDDRHPFAGQLEVAPVCGSVAQVCVWLSGSSVWLSGSSVDYRLAP